MMLEGFLWRLAEEEALAEASELAHSNLGAEEKKVKKRRLRVKFSKLMPGARQGAEGRSRLSGRKERTDA